MFYVNRNSKLKELELIIEQYQDRLFSFAFFRVGSFDVAQDIVQDVFLKFYQKNSRLDRVANIKSYLYRSILNRCNDYRRTHKQTISIEAIQNQTIAPDEKPYYEDLISIEELLVDLTDIQADVVRLHFVDNLSFVDIASLLSLSVNTVKSRFRYAIEKLKQSSKLQNFQYDE